MKRFACLMMALTALSSPASARDSYSFTIHGHRVHVEASPHCRSLSCVSISVPGVGNWRNGHRVDDDVATVNDPPPASQPAQPQAQPADAPPAAQTPSPAPAPAQPAPQVTRATIPPATQAPAQVPPAAQAQPAVQPATQPAQAQPAPVAAPRLASAPPAPASPSHLPGTGFDEPSPQQAATPPAAQDPAKPQQPAPANKPATNPQGAPDKPVVEQPAPRTNAPAARVAEQTDSAAATPVGDWQTEAKNGTVRIEACGPALCGYMLNATTGAKGETVLVNMKSKSSTQWSGNVYSRSSGNSYYGTITLKEANTLRVEACALGSFFCSGNNWTRLEATRSARPDELANSRQNPQEPRS
jgi:uncharacterized protein (DUF2147 family)